MDFAPGVAGTPSAGTNFCAGVARLTGAGGQAGIARYQGTGPEVRAGAPTGGTGNLEVGAWGNVVPSARVSGESRLGTAGVFPGQGKAPAEAPGCPGCV